MTKARALPTRPPSQRIRRPSTRPVNSAPALRKPHKKKPRSLPLPVPKVKEALDKVLSTPSAYLFIAPPSAEEFPDYQEKVTHLDLTIVAERFRSGYYARSSTKLIADVRLVWANALNYFPESHVRHQQALVKQSEFEELLIRAQREAKEQAALSVRTASPGQRLALSA